MKLVINPKEVEKKVKESESNADAIDKEIEAAKKVIIDLNNTWVGDDYDTFRSKALAYLNKLKHVSADIRTLDSQALTIAKTYKAVDTDFSEGIEKAVIEHDTDKK